MVPFIDSIDISIFAVDKIDRLLHEDVWYTMDLPIPTDLSRQVGVTEAGSPIALSRSSSEASGSPRVAPETSLRSRLLAYIFFLEHEIDFLTTEIQALVDYPPATTPLERDSFRDLHESLKIRYNLQSSRMARAKALLELL